MEDIKVSLKSGEVILTKPKSKAFAMAMEEAETENGNMKMTKLFNRLLPHCIKTHPWGARKVQESLDNLEPEEYMQLFNKIKDLINISGSDTEK